MKLFLSGAETGHAAKTLLEVKAPYVMFSYFYLRRKSWRDRQLLFQQFKDYGAEIAVHPGTLSITNNIGTSDLDKLDSYSLKYIDFIDKNKEYIDLTFGFDPFGFAPDDSIFNWYGKLSDITSNLFIRPPKATKKSINDIKHISNKIALPSGLTQTEYSRLVSPEFKKEGLLFHCMGTTKFNILKKIPWYSVDSGTWLTGGRFGAIFKYKGGLNLDRIIDTDTKDASKQSSLRQLRPKFKEKDISYSKILDNDAYEINKWNVLQWLEYSDDLSRRKKTSEYWRKTKSKKNTEMVSTHEETKIDKPKPNAMTFAQDPRLTVMRQCDTCIIADRCPLFKEGSDCRLTNTPGIENVQDLDNAAQALLTSQMDRLVHAMMVERVEGGVLTEEVSLEVERTMKMLTAHRKAVTTSKDTITIAGEGAGASLLANLLGGMNRGAAGPDGRSQSSGARRASKRRKKAAVIDAEVESDETEAEIIDMD